MNAPPAAAPGRRVGTAGWAIPGPVRAAFGDGASSLARYATRFDCVEINSSFHRRHRRETWTGWADSTPANFRFSAKLPKTITHVARLADCDAMIAEFADDVSGMGGKLAAILVQIPPSLAFDPLIAPRFFDALHAATNIQLACEPRHASWFDAAADRMLANAQVARVAADPARVAAAAFPGGWLGFRYWRLHGSPRIYRSSYEAARIAEYAATMRAQGSEAWCIFDNTASSAAAANALDLVTALATAS